MESIRTASLLPYHSTTAGVNAIPHGGGIHGWRDSMKMKPSISIQWCYVGCLEGNRVWPCAQRQEKRSDFKEQDYLNGVVSSFRQVHPEVAWLDLRYLPEEQRRWVLRFVTGTYLTGASTQLAGGSRILREKLGDVKIGKLRGFLVVT